MKCPQCGSTEFKKDGTAKFPPLSLIPYGAKQRLTCKGCGKRLTGSWVFFNRKLYNEAQRTKFNEFLKSRQAYQEAKDKDGHGGFRLSDL